MVYDCATSGSDDSCKLNASPETIFAKYLYIAYGNREWTRKYVTYNTTGLQQRRIQQYKCAYTYIMQQLVQIHVGIV